MNVTPLQHRLVLLKPSALSPEAMASRVDANADAVRKAAEGLCEGKIFSSVSSTAKSYSLTAEGAKFAKDGLPEALLVKLLATGEKRMGEVPAELVRFGLPNAKKEGLVSIANGSMALTQKGQEAAVSGALPAIPQDAFALASLPSELLQSFERRGLVACSEKQEANYSLTDDGARLLEAGQIAVQEDGAGTLTRAMLIEGTWRNAPFRPYDIGASAPLSFAARRHPISALREKIRGIFARMGFSEMSGPHVESAFWNFDALFQPQDHPARDLADTFYVSGKSRLPQHALVERVRHAHEAGWKYKWDEAPAMRRLLRTHTTAVSARNLSASAKNGPTGGSEKHASNKRFFSVGKVFRNEATDYKHLAEFFQVEGVISWEGATFTDLLGTLKEFYSQLGFEKIRFRPSFFPYTEPSLEIEVYYEPRQAWLELGGAGILRPEVCSPLGAPYPTLAWGLSLERPLMISNKIDDIRALYRNELGWLRNFPAK